MASRNVILASAGYDATIRFWDISGGHSKRTLKYEDNPESKVKLVTAILLLYSQPVNSMAFSPDGAFIAVSSIKSFKVYETESERHTPKVGFDFNKELTSSIQIRKPTSYL